MFYGLGEYKLDWAQVNHVHKQFWKILGTLRFQMLDKERRMKGRMEWWAIWIWLQHFKRSRHRGVVAIGEKAQIKNEWKRMKRMKRHKTWTDFVVAISVIKIKGHCFYSPTSGIYWLDGCALFRLAALGFNHSKANSIATVRQRRLCSVCDRYKVRSYCINPNHPKPFQDANGKLELDDLIFLEMLGIGTSWNCVRRWALRISLGLSMCFEQLAATSD